MVPDPELCCKPMFVAEALRRGAAHISPGTMVLPDWVGVEEEGSQTLRLLIDGSGGRSPSRMRFWRQEEEGKA